jgi:hypothetical protein
LPSSQNSAFRVLNCYNNQLTDLDLTSNDLLLVLRCDSNNLSCLNIKNGNNFDVNVLSSTNNPNLSCIEVDDTTWFGTNWTGNILEVDPQTSFSNNCNPCATSVGIEESKFSNLSFYPNPTSRKLSIDTELNINEINIIDLRGNILNSIKNNLNDINVSDLPTGIYFLKVMTDEKIITKKFVKQ